MLKLRYEAEAITLNIFYRIVIQCGKPQICRQPEMCIFFQQAHFSWLFLDLVEEILSQSHYVFSIRIKEETVHGHCCGFYVKLKC